MTDTNQIVGSSLICRTGGFLSRQAKGGVVECFESPSLLAAVNRYINVEQGAGEGAPWVNVWRRSGGVGVEEGGLRQGRLPLTVRVA